MYTYVYTYIFMYVYMCIYIYIYIYIYIWPIIGITGNWMAPGDLASCALGL